MHQKDIDINKLKEQLRQNGIEPVIPDTPAHSTSDTDSSVQEQVDEEQHGASSADEGEQVGQIQRPQAQEEGYSAETIVVATTPPSHSVASSTMQQVPLSAGCLSDFSNDDSIDGNTDEFEGSHDSGEEEEWADEDEDEDERRTDKVGKLQASSGAAEEECRNVLQDHDWNLRTARRHMEDISSQVQVSANPDESPAHNVAASRAESPPDEPARAVTIATSPSRNDATTSQPLHAVRELAMPESVPFELIVRCYDSKHDTRMSTEPFSRHGRCTMSALDTSITTVMQDVFVVLQREEPGYMVQEAFNTGPGRRRNPQLKADVSCYLILQNVKEWEIVRDRARRNKREQFIKWMTNNQIRAQDWLDMMNLKFAPDIYPKNGYRHSAVMAYIFKNSQQQEAGRAINRILGADNMLN